MKKAGTVFLGLILRILIVLCGVGLYLQDLVSEYLYVWFDRYLSNVELGYLFLAAVTVVHILFLLIKLITALFLRKKNPKTASQNEPAGYRTGFILAGLAVWVIVLACAAGLFMDDGELGFFFLASAHAIYVPVLLVKLIVILIRKSKTPEPRKSGPVDPPEAPAQSVEPPSPPPASPKFCSACGAGLEPGDRYCPQCGQRLSFPASGGQTG